MLRGIEMELDMEDAFDFVKFLFTLEQIKV